MRIKHIFIGDPKKVYDEIKLRDLPAFDVFTDDNEDRCLIRDIAPMQDKDWTWQCVKIINLHTMKEKSFEYSKGILQMHVTDLTPKSKKRTRKGF